MTLSGSNNPFFGKHHTEESLQKNRLAHLGKHPSIETRIKLSKAGKERVLSEEHKQKIAQALKGKIKTDAHKRHISESKKSKHCVLSEEQKIKISNALKGRPSPNKGKHPSDITRQKLSIALKGRKLKPFTDEHRKKISDARTGTKRPPVSDETRKKLSDALTGRKFSEEALFKMSLAKKGRTLSPTTREKLSIAHSGEKCHLWKGGISFEPYCPKFNNRLKEEIRNKYGRKCLLCGAPENGRRLDIHHVDYDKQQGCNGKKWELVPLCLPCHSKTNNSREYWNNIIRNKINTSEVI